VVKSWITAHPEVGRAGGGGATLTLPGETEAALKPDRSRKLLKLHELYLSGSTP
jgi:hypothetical protein